MYFHLSVFYLPSLLSYSLSIFIFYRTVSLSHLSAAAPEDVRLSLYIDAVPGPTPDVGPKLEFEDIERGAEEDRTTVRPF